MKQYSIVVHAAREVAIADPDVFLEAGTSVFTVFTNDASSVRARLERLDVMIVSLECIEQPSTTLDDLLLDGETPAVLGSHARRLRS